MNDYNIFTDQYGIRTIETCIMSDIWKAVGYLTALDRLWQATLNYLACNGKLSSVFGIDYIDSDTIVLQLSYNDEDLEKQYEKLDGKVKCIIENYVIGFNDYVDYVSANQLMLPYEFGYYEVQPFRITKFDVLRLYYYILYNSSGMFIDSFNVQLNNALLYNALTSKFNIEDTNKIFNDIVGVYGVTKTSWPILNDGDVEHISPFSKIIEDPPLDLENIELLENLDKLSKKINNCYSKFNKLGIFTKIGSMGAVLSKDLTVNGNSILCYAPQSGFNVPPYYYLLKCNNQKLQFFNTLIPGIPIFFNGLFGNPCSQYYFSTCIQSNKTVSADLLIESPENIYIYREVVLFVRNSTPITLVIYRSKSDGFVLDSETAITLRTVFLNKQLECLNIFKYIFSNNFKELFDLLINLFQGDLLGFNMIGNDIHNNIFDINMGNWQRLPSNYDRRIPQGILNNPVPNTNEYEIVPAIGSYNTNFNYYVCWNNPFMQGIPYTYEKAEYNRTEWIQGYIENRNDFTYENAYELFLWMGTANNMETGLSNTQDYNSDIFAQYLSKLFLPVAKKYANKNISDSLEILKCYNGQWINGDFNDLVYSKNISSKWILANSWTAQFMLLLLNKTLDDTPLQLFTGSEPFILTASILPNDYKSLIIRILKLGKYNNKLYYDWLSGIDIEYLIIQSLINSLELLGGIVNYPWGINKRPLFIYETIYGQISQQYSLNRGTLYLVCEMDCTGVKFGIITGPGNSGFVQRIGNNANPDLHYNDFASMYTEFKLINYVPFPLYINPDISICLRKFKHRKYVRNCGNNSQIINTSKCAEIKVISMKQFL